MPRLPLLLALVVAPLPSLWAGEKGAPQPAEIRVLIAEHAELLIDDYRARQTGADRRFVTPPLQPGREFSYTLKATWLEGKRQVVRMAVAKVRAGKETVIDLRQGSKDGSSSQVVYVPTPQAVVDKMLEMAKVTKDDVVFDLGCGDGRVVATAAKKFGARGVGIDIDPDRIADCRKTLEAMAVDPKLVEIRQGDALKVPDLERATVVMTYMLPEFMEKLKPILQERLRPGTRIVAHDYVLPGWPPKRTVTVTGTGRIYPHTLHLWTVPERKKQ